MHDLSTKSTQWYCCPHCGKRLLKVTERSYASNIYIKCKGCREIVEVKISPAYEKTLDKSASPAEKNLAFCF